MAHMHICSPAQDAASVAEAQMNTFANARDLKAATNFPGQKTAVISRLKEADLRAHAAVKDVLTDEHQQNRLALLRNSVDRLWDTVIFSDKSTFSSASEGPVLIYRPWGERLQLSICVDLHT
jgi:hypothetical protein